MPLHECDVEAVDDLACGREGLDGARQIEQPGPAELLVEASGVNRLNARPVRLEILQPLTHRAVVMKGTVLYGVHIQAILFHEQQRLGQAGNVAAGENMRDRAVVGRTFFYIERRGYQADSAGAQADGNAPDPLLIAIPASVLMNADRNKAIVA